MSVARSPEKLCLGLTISCSGLRSSALARLTDGGPSSMKRELLFCTAATRLVSASSTATEPGVEDDVGMGVSLACGGDDRRRFGRGCRCAARQIQLLIARCQLRKPLPAEEQHQQHEHRNDG